MPPSSPSSLAAQAQQRLHDRRAPAPGGPTTQFVGEGVPADVQRLVQELQVHQLELEMQYEELQAAHATAEAARAKFAELYNFAPTALFTLHADGSIAQLNDRASRLLGTTAARLVGRRFLLFVGPPSRDAFTAFWANLLGTPQRQSLELHLQTEAGVGFVAHVEGAPGTTPTGGAGVQLAVVDVTPLSHEVAQRQRSEERLQLALAASAMGVWVWTFDTNLLEWDAQAQKCFGRPYDPSPTSFAVLQTAVHSDEWVPVQRTLQACRQHGHPLDLELRAQWPDGSVHFLAAHGKVQPDAQGRPAALVGLVRDVTDRRTAQEALDYRNRQLQQLFDNLPVVFSRLSPTGEYLEMAGAGLRRVDLADNALLGRSILDEFPTISDPVRRLLAGQPSSFLGVADTADQRVYFQNFGFFDEYCQQAVLFAIDVTESEQTKKQLLEEQRFTKNLLDHYVDGVVAFDHTGRLTAWNRAMEALTGRAEAEALGQDVLACLPFDRESPLGLVIDLLLKGLRRPRFHQPFAWPGLERDFELTAIPLPQAGGADGAGGLLMLRDVTERNRMHALAAHLKAQQQRETFRMVLMAQEIERKRIAEDLHNGVGQLLYATKLRLEASASGATDALLLLEEAIKATRNVSFELTPSILEDFGLTVALQKLAKTIPAEKLRLQVYLSGLDRPLPQALNAAIYRMVQELLNNVIKHSRAEEATLHVAHEGDHVHISMEDNGSGFDVTTTVGQVKGIGLAALHNRAALLGGQFELVSRPGRGTIATLSLPIVADELDPPTSAAGG